MKTFRYEVPGNKKGEWESIIVRAKSKEESEKRLKKCKIKKFRFICEVYNYEPFNFHKAPKDHIISSKIRTHSLSSLSRGAAKM